MESHAKRVVPEPMQLCVALTIPNPDYWPFFPYWRHDTFTSSQCRPIHHYGPRPLVFKCLLSILAEMQRDRTFIHWLLIRLPIFYSNNHVAFQVSSSE